MACVAIRTGMEIPGNEGLPDAARVMMNTRAINDWSGAAYTFEQVAEMDWLVFDMMGAIRQAADPPGKKNKPKASRGPKILKGRK